MILAPEIEAYAEARTSQSDPELARLAQDTRDTQTQPQMLTGPVAGRLLEFLVWMVRPMLVVELGTYSGYSALTMASALPEGGRVVTCELDADRAAFAQSRFDESPHSAAIELKLGRALESLAAIDEPIDLAFVDADKEGYIGYYEALVPKLSPRGVIVADNTLRDGRALDPEEVMDAFNRHVADDPRTVQLLLTVRDGMTLIRRA